MNSIRSQILRHTRPSRRHLTPELSLRLITPSCPLWDAPADQAPFPDPFWAFYWPGGQAMARYVLDNPYIVKNRCVVDVGCGCGAGAIAARMVGAAHVVGNDIDPYSTFVTEMNSEINGVTVETNTNNLIGSKCDDFDTILIGDMFYDEEFGEFLFTWLSNLVAQDKQVLIGDPGRHGLTAKRRGQMTLLSQYELSPQTNAENHGFTHAALWMLTK